MAGNRQDWFLLLLVFIFAAFLSILIHELGHALMIRKYGLSTAITLQAFGGFATYPSGHLDRKQSFLVTAAGPTVQFAFGVLLIILGRFLNIPEGSLFLPFLVNLILVSIVWSVLKVLHGRRGIHGSVEDGFPGVEEPHDDRKDPRTGGGEQWHPCRSRQIAAPG